MSKMITDSILNETVRRIRLVVFDFDGVFTDNAVYVFEDGSEAVRCWRGDALGLKKLESLAIAFFVLSTETNPVVGKRCSKLGVRCLQGCPDKLPVLAGEVAALSLEMAQVAYVGNDVNDRECLQAVGLPIVVHDAHEDVLALARYQSRACGGRGAVREICDLFWQAHNIK
jgi:3-deoxy-D-manno-octulosonate 8-phosphate phosphatase (KDO 8-P phosphatase)